MFSAVNGVKKSVAKKIFKNVWKSQNTLLNKPLIKEQVLKEN